MNSIIKWFINNSFKTAATKTHAIVFQNKSRSKRKYPKLKIDGIEIDYQPKVKFLGVTFQENLQWNEYVSQCINSANKGLHLM